MFNFKFKIMKKINLSIFAASLVAISSLFTSCKDDTETTPVAKDSVVTYTAVILNNEFATEGKCFYSVSDNTIFPSIAAAKTASSLVDFIHLLRATTKGDRIICAPSDSNTTVINQTGDDKISTWTVRNATKFGKITSSITWSSVDSTVILNNTAALTATAATNLKEGDIYGFVTVSGVKGIFKVIDIKGTDFESEGNNAGSIEIEVKKIVVVQPKAE